MGKEFLSTKIASEVAECNATPYGYPSPGVPLSGGIVAAEIGGVGWTVQEFQVEESETGSFVVEIETTKVPAATLAKLASKIKKTKPEVKPKKEK